jgi:hypothetical protein
MTLRMYDSITPANLPPGADAYAGYTSGLWPDFPDIQRLFPHVRLLSIAVNAAHDADCLDVENGDATIAEVYPWFNRQVKRGVWRPVIYTSASNAQALNATMHANGFPRASYRLWLAHWGDGKHICGPGLVCGYPRADGTQWTAAAAGTHGTHVDESLLAADFFPTPPTPAVGPFEHHTGAHDTWAKIAYARNTSIEHLAQLNAGVELLPGQRYLTTNP